jgi:hypothetical protein
MPRRRKDPPVKEKPRNDWSLRGEKVSYYSNTGKTWVALEHLPNGFFKKVNPAHIKWPEVRAAVIAELERRVTSGAMDLPKYDFTHEE